MDAAPPKKSFTRFIPVVGRVLFGLALLASGLMGLFAPMTPPPDLAEGAKAFSAALQATGYMMPMIGIVMAVCGAMLVSGLFAPLALVLLAPFWVNSVLFHVFLEHSGLVPSLVFTAWELALAWHYRAAYASLLQMRPTKG